MSITRIHDLFSEGVTPLKVAFWTQPHHWTALAQGMGADEAEALRYEYSLILSGQRDALGHPCLCGDKTLKFPSAVRGGMGGGSHDSLGSIVGLVADLKRAADALPLSWYTTRRVYWVQGRAKGWTEKVALAYCYPRKERSFDRMPDLGAAHAYLWMATALGYRSVSKWPRKAAEVTPMRRVLEPVQEAA